MNDGTLNKLKTIVVSNIPTGLCEDEIIIHFQSSKHGGGDVEDVVVLPDGHEALVTFEELNVVDKVLQQQQEIKGNLLHVQRYESWKKGDKLTVETTEDPSNDKTTLIVENLGPDTTEECLRNKMEVVTKLEVRKIVFGKNKNAIVILDGEADNDCLQTLKERKLKGSIINAAFAPLTYAIKIRRIPKSTTKDEIIDKFENQRNGGGKITDMILDRKKRIANVFFEDYSVVSKLVKTKHELRGTELLVSPYYDCFEELEDETSKDTSWRFPVQCDIMSFVSKRYDIKSKFDLNSMNFDPEQEMLHFSKQFDDPKEAEILEFKLKSFLNSFVQDSMKIPQNVSRKLEELLEVKREEFQDKSVGVRYDPQCSTLFLTGEQKHVDSEKKSLITVIELLQEQLKPDSTEFTINDKNKLLFLNFIAYSNKVMTEFPDVRINGLEGTSGKIMLTGTKESVKDVKLRILEDFQGIAETNLAMSKRQIEFLKRDDCKLVNNEFKKSDANAMLYICSAETPGKTEMLEAKLTTLKISDDISSLKNVVFDMTSEKCVQIDDETGRFLSKSKKLKDFQQQLHNNEMMVEFEITDPSKIWIVGEKSKICKAFEETVTFTTSNAILSCTFQFNETHARFLTSYLKNEVDAVRERLVAEGVQIDYLGSGSFTLKGTKAGVKQATDSLRSLLEKVVSQFYEMKGPGVKKQLEMDSTAAIITGIEKENQCIFERNACRDDPAAHEGVVSKKVSPLSSDDLLVISDKEIKTKSGRKISVVIGDLSQQTVDVMVNTTNDKVELDANPCGQALLKVAGQELKDACQKVGNLQVGKIATTKAGKLDCNLVYHVNCAAWDNGKGESVLRQIVKSCLNAIHNDKLKSIAIPAIGTGNLRFPHSVVANVFFEEAVRFLTDNRETTLNDIRFVAYHRDQPSIDAFMKKIKVMKPTISAAIAKDSNDSKRPNLGSCRMNYKSDGNLDVFLGKNLIVQIALGDITKESTKLIMHVTNKQLSLQGGVAKSLIKAGGDIIAKECQKISPVDLFSVNFTSAGSLSVAQIVHVAAPDQPAIQDLRKCLEKFFMAILKHKVPEISFSAIGCGVIGLSENDSADLIFTALCQISEKADLALRLVRIVIFEKSKFEKFKTAVKGISRGDNKPVSFSTSSSATTSVLTSAATSKIAKEEETGDTQLCFRIYGQDKKVIEKAWRELSTKLKELIHEAKIKDQDVKKLSKTEIREIVKLGTKHDVEVRVEKDLGRVTIRGHSSDVSSVHNKVHKMLKNIMDREKKVSPLPDYWDKQPSDASGKELSFCKVELKSTSPDYMKVSKAFLKTASAQKIVKIERIQNVPKFLLYTAVRKGKNGVGERYLFHGTNRNNIDSINHDGWNRSYAGTNGTAYGKGVYFARDASYSCQSRYSPPDSQGYRYVYYARVLVGDYTNGSSSMIVPPPKHDPGNPNAKFDSVVDNVNDPTIFVLFYDREHYPEYLITFK